MKKPTCDESMEWGAAAVQVLLDFRMTFCGVSGVLFERLYRLDHRRPSLEERKSSWNRFQPYSSNMLMDNCQWPIWCGYGWSNGKHFVPRHGHIAHHSISFRRERNIQHEHNTVHISTRLVTRRLLTTSTCVEKAPQMRL